MREELKKNILEILEESYSSIKNRDVIVLKDLSNRTLHSASIVQDDDSVYIAILIYSLSKIFERSKYEKYKDWNLFYNTCMKNLESAADNLHKNNIIEYEKNVKGILDIINKLSSHLKIYIQEVIDKAKIHKGSRLHEHGISVGRTAELLGISEWELMDYVGKTGISDVSLSLTREVVDRLKDARRILK